MEIQRQITRQIKLGGLAVGGGAPVMVQSMTNTDTRNVPATVEQIQRLEAAGCEAVRLAVLDEEAAASLLPIRRQVTLPLIADIHFNYRLALQAMAAGVDGLRLNPGNIGGAEKVARVVEVARERRVPIRIGVNAGSLEKSILAQTGGVTAQGMVASALNHVRLLEDLNYLEIKISLKAADVGLTVEAYRLLSRQVNYPLHLGITEAGTVLAGSVKSAVGLGILLAEGIGDTLRVSLTSDPVEEIKVAYTILGSLGLRRRGVELISCPTCGRCQIDLVPLAEEVERRLSSVTKPLRVAVMGCAVNGPGEARQADVGIAGGRGFGLVFRGGQVVGRVPQEGLVEALLREVENLSGEKLPTSHVKKP